MALELRRVQMPLRPASPASDKFMSPSAQKLRFFHATLFTGLPPELRRGKSSTGYGDVVRGVALRGCKQKQDAHCKRMLVAVMLHSCTITERPHFCASLKNFSRLQDGRNCMTPYATRTRGSFRFKAERARGSIHMPGRSVHLQEFATHRHRILLPVKTPTCCR